MKYEIQLTGIDGIIDTLKSLPAEVLGARGGPARAALREGAKVIQRQELANLDVVTSNATSKNKKLSIGRLKQAVIVSRGKVGAINGERYVVRVLKKTYSGRKGNADTNTQLNAARLEYGTSKQPAEPWIRPAFNSKAEEAIRTVEANLIKGVNAAVAKLAAANKGK